MPPAPDRVGRQLDRIENLLAKLERAYRTAYELGYATTPCDNGRRRSGAVADPTALLAIRATLELERRFVAAAAAKIGEAADAMQSAWQNLQEAARIVEDARPPSAPSASGPLVTRQELAEARRIRERREDRESRQRKDARSGKWVDLD